MANTNGTDTGVSPDGSTNVGLHNQQQSVPNASQGDLQNGGAGQQSNAIPAPNFVHSNPAINTIYTKKSYNMDAVDVLIGVSPQTGLWDGIKYEYWVRQLHEAFVTNNIDSEKEKIFLARSKIDSSNNNTIKSFIESCKDISEYSMLMYSQTKEVVSERVKKSLILAQFLEHCPKRWRNRVIEVANIDLNISEQIKVILNTTKHELLINNWRNLEEGEQIAHINKN